MSEQRGGGGGLEVGYGYGGRGGATGIGKEAYQVRIKYVSGAVMHKTSSLVESARRASCAHGGK